MGWAFGWMGVEPLGWLGLGDEKCCRSSEAEFFACLQGQAGLWHGTSWLRWRKYKPDKDAGILFPARHTVEPVLLEPSFTWIAATVRA